MIGEYDQQALFELTENESKLSCILYVHVGLEHGTVLTGMAPNRNVVKATSSCN